MDNSLLAGSDTLRKKVDEVKRILPHWRLRIAPEKMQRRDATN